MKKFLLVSLLVLSILATTVCLIACNPDGEDEKPFVAPSFDFTLPEDLPDYALTIEWIGSNGSATNFIPNRPTAIVFNGVTEYNRKEGINLDAELYNSSVIGSSITLERTSYLWYRHGWNIGVFHYENFADDTNANVTNKVFNSTTMTYVNESGATITATPDFNLTEAFISTYLKQCTDEGLKNSGGKYLQEVRFIGNGVGATLAVSCAEYLDYLYENGAVGVGYLPDRIDVIDPYFSNDGVATGVDFYEQTTIGSALNFNSKAIVELADKGTVFTLVESDEKFYDSYANRYSGVSVIDDKVTFTEEGDSALYLDIKEKVAYLNFRETFSTKLPESYQALGRTTLDWFLYTINGSDSSSITSQSETDIRPMIDGYNLTGTGVNTSVKYSVSAWTPTIYLRAVRGREYNMKKYSTNTQKITDYTLDRFQAENFQMSNLSMKDAYAVCGYVYLQEDNTYFVNLNRSARIENAIINLTITLEDKSTIVDVTTDKDGFYYYNLGEELLGASVAIVAVTPSKNYDYTTSDATSSSNYKYVNKNMITSASGISTTLSSTKDQNFFLYFASAGFTK